MNSYGSDQIMLTTNLGSGFDGCLSLSPDGSKIDYERNGEIWVMNSDASNQIRLTNNSFLSSKSHQKIPGTMDKEIA